MAIKVLTSFANEPQETVFARARRNRDIFGGGVYIVGTPTLSASYNNGVVTITQGRVIAGGYEIENTTDYTMSMSYNGTTTYYIYIYLYKTSTGGASGSFNKTTTQPSTLIDFDNNTSVRVPLFSVKITNGTVSQPQPIAQYAMDMGTLTQSVRMFNDVVNNIYPVGSVIFLGKGVTPESAGLIGKWVKLTSMSINSVKDVNYVIDINGGVIANGTNLSIFEKNNTVAQAWCFRDQGFGDPIYPYGRVS